MFTSLVAGTGCVTVRVDCWQMGCNTVVFLGALFSQHAYALELLHDQLYDGAKALDVGSGSGILSACFARMVSHTWRVNTYSFYLVEFLLIH